EAACTSRPWIENVTMLRFMVTQPAIERRSVMRFSTSWGSSVGIAMPGIGTPSGPHRRRNISNGSACGAGLESSAMGGALGGLEECFYLGLARDRVLVAEVDERAAEGFLEKEVARKVRARAGERAGRAQDEAHGRRQLVDEARRDALDRLRRRDEQHFHRPQLDRRLRHALARDQADGAVDALQPLDVDHQAVEEDAVQRVAGDLRERGIDVR